MNPIIKRVYTAVINTPWNRWKKLFVNYSETCNLLKKVEVVLSGSSDYILVVAVMRSLTPAAQEHYISFHLWVYLIGSLDLGTSLALNQRLHLLWARATANNGISAQSLL